MTAPPTLLISYPKSGRTWLRFMLNDYLARRRGLDVPNVFAVETAPGAAYPVQWTHLTAAMLMDLPYWTMGALDLRPFDGARALLLVREPRATMASAYRHAMHRIGRWDGPAAPFLRSPQYGVMKLVTLLNLWGALVPRLGAHAVMAYESALAAPPRALAALLEFVGEPVDDDLVETVAAGATLERLRALGLDPAYRGTPLAPADPTNPQSYKVRVGGRGDAGSVFSPEDLALIDRLVADLVVEPDAAWRRPMALEPAKLTSAV